MDKSLIDTEILPGASRDLLALGVEVAGLGLGVVDYQSDTIMLDKRAGEIFDLDMNVAIPRRVLHGRIHADERGDIVDQVNCLLQSGSTDFVDVEHRVVKQDGTVAWVRARKQIVFAQDGANDEFTARTGIVAIQDITEFKETQQKLHFVLGEVNHRSKNLLNVVQSIARMTARSGDPETFSERFSSRISSLAANQDLMVHDAWTSVDLRRLVLAQMQPFLDENKDRLVIEGEPVFINSDAAQAIGMAIHELATNASKYGALSNDRGLVYIQWRSQADDSHDFSLSWKEVSGPEVALPERTGFGQTVIKDMAASALKGDVTLDYHPEGVAWSVRVPEENLSFVLVR